MAAGRVPAVARLLTPDEQVGCSVRGARLVGMERQREYVLRTVEERGVRMVRLWFTDVLGQLKSFAISPAELENAFDDWMRFDGSSIDGFSRVQEADVLAKPDPNSFELLPWADHLGTSA